MICEIKEPYVRRIRQLSKSVFLQAHSDLFRQFFIQFVVTVPHFFNLPNKFWDRWQKLQEKILIVKYGIFF